MIPQKITFQFFLSMILSTLECLYLSNNYRSVTNITSITNIILSNYNNFNNNNIIFLRYNYQSI